MTIVQAVVLTFSAPQSLECCVRSIAAQTRAPDHVLIVDNGGSPPVDRSVLYELTRKGIDAVLHTMDRNTGPAGGHFHGLKHFLDGTCDVAWVMDDDCEPEPDALERLLAANDSREHPSLVYPTWLDPEGTDVSYPAWCGLIIPRAIVEEVGLPLADLVWWTEDTEYLHNRIRWAGYESVRLEDARVIHRQVRRLAAPPAWKTYYEVRNTIFLGLHRQQGRTENRHRPLVTMAKATVRLTGRSLLQHGQRLDHLIAVCRGVIDGLFGRLGQRYLLPQRASRS